MKDVIKNWTRYPAYLLVLCLTLGLSSCSDDDDGIIEPDPTGFFDVEEVQFLSGNTLTLGTIEVGQDSWLVAVLPGDEGTDNFVAGPVMLQEGSNSSVTLNFDDNVVPADGSQEVILKLYTDDQNEGTQGEFDEADREIMDDDGMMLLESILVFGENSNEATFNALDINNDNMLDVNELPAIYQDNFGEWDTDDDGELSSTEFYDTAFFLSDTDDDDLIDEDEWNMGFNSFYGEWIDDDFATFDADADGFLDADEWDNAFADSAWFGDFDADDDTFVTDTEWDEGIFDGWDLDDDTFIDDEEWNDFADFVTFW